MSFPYPQQQRTFSTGSYSNNLPSLHDYHSQQQPQHQLRHDLPPPLHLNTEQHPQQQPYLPSVYESRKLYQCNEPGCGDYFDHPNALRSHSRTVHGRSEEEQHTRASSASSQSRPYVCPYAECGKSFTQYGNLKTHSRKHTGERPYHCTYEGCDKAFTQLGNLKTHEKIHWPVKPFMCGFPNCGKGFTQRGNLKTHQVKVHQITPQ